MIVLGVGRQKNVIGVVAQPFAMLVTHVDTDSR